MSAIYHISPGYRRCVVWQGNDEGGRICVQTIVPNKKFSRREKYEVIAHELVRLFKLPPPNYITIYREKEVAAMRMIAGRWTA